MKHYKSVEFCQFLECQAPPPDDGFDPTHWRV